MTYCLKIKNSEEIKTTVNADNLEKAIDYFSKYEHLQKNVLIKLYRIVPFRKKI
tara:strand:- start:871 stop:1032 length:162 start_codon:yes stop_codon:yes gene_type:complete